MKSQFSASNSLESAQTLAAGHSTVSAVLLDAGNLVALEKLVSDADVVVSYGISFTLEGTAHNFYCLNLDFFPHHFTSMSLNYV